MLKQMGCTEDKKLSKCKCCWDACPYVFCSMVFCYALPPFNMKMKVTAASLVWHSNICFPLCVVLP